MVKYIDFKALISEIIYSCANKSGYNIDQVDYDINWDKSYLWELCNKIYDKDYYDYDYKINGIIMDDYPAKDEIIKYYPNRKTQLTTFNKLNIYNVSGWNSDERSRSYENDNSELYVNYSPNYFIEKKIFSVSDWSTWQEVNFSDKY